MEEVIKETMESYDSYIDRLGPGTEFIIKQIHNEQYQEAKQNLINLLEGLMWLVEVNNKLSQLNYVTSLDTNKLNSLSEDILEAISKNDFNLCADILEYELIDLTSTLIKYSNN
ncbi:MULTISPECIES: hypothetical protein [Lysinibacillus]|jgi:hypothetical protein|uniref:hypothetical protein n=1 Tax=Lysinibacillus TaxID=400634 RepID=UPI0004D3A5B3|nr:MULTISPECIES: hypothetical protein [Lysinibacillus]AJK89323.1 hypothetical protein HR49_20320 [Lysinibacillus fusiformis]KHK52238.1 hypothetical protein PI85_09815 [Lysinibacillus sp. A1]